MNRYRLLTLAIGGGVLLVVFALLRHQLGLAYDPESLRAAVGGLGIWGPLVFIGIVAFRVPLGMPSQLVLIGGGLVFGTLVGTLYGALGLTVSAGVLFATSRWAGQESIMARVPTRLQPLFDIAGSRFGASFIALGTGYPFGPITMYHLIAGVTKLPAVLFLAAVAVGSTVRAATFTYFGSSLMSGEADRVLQASALLLLAGLAPLAFPGPRAWLLQAIGRGKPQNAGEGTGS